MLGLHVISSLIREGKSPYEILRAGLSRDDFTEDEKPVLRFYASFWEEYQKAPDRKTVKRQTRVKLPDSPEPAAFYLEQLRKQKRLGIARKVINNLEERIRNLDVDDISSEFIEAQNSLGALDLQDQFTTIPQHLSEIIDIHDARQHFRSSEITFGFPVLDRYTLGAQPGDFVVIGGRPGSMKTFFLIHFALSAFRAGKRIMFVTLEMPGAQIARRSAAMLCGISEDYLRFGRLGTVARRNFMEQVSSIRQSNRFSIFSGSLQTNIEMVLSRAQEFRPDALYCDGAYMFRTAAKFTSERERLTYIVNRLRAASLDLNIPVFASFQMNRQAVKKSGASIEHAYGSDAIGQYAALFMALDHSSQQQSVLSTEIVHKKMAIIKSREHILKNKYTFDFNPLTTSFTETTVLEVGEEDESDAT